MGRNSTPQRRENRTAWVPGAFISDAGTPLPGDSRHLSLVMNYAAKTSVIDIAKIMAAADQKVRELKEKGEWK